MATLLVISSLVPAAIPPRGANLNAQYTETTSIYVRAMRTGWGEAAVLGVQNGTGSGVSVSILVNGTITNSTTTIYNGEFWRLHVHVWNGSTVQAAIGNNISFPVTVPGYKPQPVAPAGIIYAQGSQLFVNGTPIQLFGVDEETGFTYAMIADGLLGWTNPSQYWGNNQLFPSGPSTKIPGVSSVDQFWQKFFQYFLHYNQVAGNATNPKVNVIRLTVVDDTFVPEGAYTVWKNNPTAFWQVFDSMLYWAGRAGLYVVPVLGHIAQRGTSTVETWYDTSTPEFAHHVDLVRAILARYNNNTRIAMWDLWNEPDVNNDVYWASVGGIAAFRAWATTLISDVKPYSSNHLLTMGMCDWTIFPGLPTSFGWEWYFFFNDMPGLDVGSNHYYASAEDLYLISWQTAWHQALNIPEFQGEFGYGKSGGNPLGYGYWPWFAQNAMAQGWSLATMVFLDDGVGPYADYPYLGALPDYPPGGNQTGPNPVASFTYSPSAPTVGQSVAFDGSLSSDSVPITSYAWTFGDGGSGNGVTVNHAFSAAGTYAVSLTITDQNGSSNSTSKYVQVTSSGNPPPTPPSVSTSPATSIGTSNATLNGNLNGLGDASSVSVGFRWGTSPSLAGATNVTVSTRSSPGAFSSAVSGLSGGTTYYFAAWASGDGFVAGSILSFVPTTTPPSVATYAATSKGQTTATLNGYLSALGSASSVAVGFLYDTSSTLSAATNVTATTLTSPGPFSAAVQGLTTGTTYYYRAWASGAGFASGDVQSFVAANPGTSVPQTHTTTGHGSGPTTATLNGSVTSLGSATAVNVGFLYGTSPSLVGAVNVTVGILAAPGNFTLNAGGLYPGLTYYYEAWAEGQGFAAGEILNLTTPWSIPPPSPGVLGVTYDVQGQTLDVFFSESMNRSSVEGALVFSPLVSYQSTWINDSYLRIYLDAPLTVDAEYSLTIKPSAQGAEGLTMDDPFVFRFAVPAATPSMADAGWTAWLPWITVGLATGCVLALVLFLRGRRKLRVLRQTTRTLTSRIEELRAANARLTPRTGANTGLRPVPVRRTVLKPIPRTDPRAENP
jgi:hypothetical protein